MNNFTQLGDLKVYEEKYLANPYPEQPDDGTWEGEGGYVARPNHQVWMMAPMPSLYGYTQPIAIVHPLTMGEIEYAVMRDKLLCP